MRGMSKFLGLKTQKHLKWIVLIHIKVGKMMSQRVEMPNIVSQTIRLHVVANQKKAGLNGEELNYSVSGRGWAEGLHRGSVSDKEGLFWTVNHAKLLWGSWKQAEQVSCKSTSCFSFNQRLISLQVIENLNSESSLFDLSGDLCVILDEQHSARSSFYF